MRTGVAQEVGGELQVTLVQARIAADGTATDNTLRPASVPRCGGARRTAEAGNVASRTMGAITVSLTSHLRDPSVQQLRSQFSAITRQGGGGSVGGLTSHE